MSGPMVPWRFCANFIFFPKSYDINFLVLNIMAPMGFQISDPSVGKDFENFQSSMFDRAPKTFDIKNRVTNSPKNTIASPCIPNFGLSFGQRGKTFANQRDRLQINVRMSFDAAQFFLWSTAFIPALEEVQQTAKVHRWQRIKKTRDGY